MSYPTRHERARTRWRAAWRLMRAATRTPLRALHASTRIETYAQEALYQRTVCDALTTMRAACTHRRAGTCPKCSGTRWVRRYPGNDPESGPMRSECRRCRYAPADDCPQDVGDVWHPGEAPPWDEL
jgi:hypothetical protein